MLTAEGDCEGLVNLVWVALNRCALSTANGSLPWASLRRDAIFRGWPALVLAWHAASYVPVSEAPGGVALRSMSFSSDL